MTIARVFRTAGLLLASAAFFVAPAEARRTAIDFSDPDNPQTLQLDGYCDLDGLDCQPQALGYTIDFGFGAVSEFIVYGNGMISFGPTPVGYQDTTNLADYGATVIASGLDNSLVAKNPQDLSQGSAYSLVGGASFVGTPGNPSQSLQAIFYRCYTPQNCYNDIAGSFILTPVADGLEVYAPAQTGSSIYGYALPDGSGFTKTSNLNGDRFVIPARITSLSVPGGVPEPAMWAMMIGGFGMVGAATRRRRPAAMSLTA